MFLNDSTNTKQRFPLLLFAVVSFVLGPTHGFLPLSNVATTRISTIHAPISARTSSTLLLARQNLAKSKRNVGKITSKKQAKGKKATQKSKSPSGGSKNPPQTQTSNRQPRSPPWQVLSTKDAKKNIKLEKMRRAGESTETATPEKVTVSTTFLSAAERSFLHWKRFNPSGARMKFEASVLGQLPPQLGVPEIAFLGR